MKRIAFVTRVLSSGGAELVLRQIILACSARGMECLLLALQHENDMLTWPSNVEIKELVQAGSNLSGKFQEYSQARRFICDFKADIVFSMPEDIGIYVILAMLGTGIPVVVSERNNPWVMPYKKVTRFLRRIAYPFARGLIFQTEQAASFFPQSQRKKGIVLPNPLDLSRLPEPYAGELTKTVVSAGRLDDQKNFPLLIRAFAEFHKNHPDYSLIIYGEGHRRPELEQLAGQCLHEGSWSLPGKVDDLPFRISRCEIFALSSDYEGVPNVLIEAMAVGTPAVSTDCAPGGAASLIRNGENGLLVPTGNVRALAEGLSYLADHPAEASAMAAAALTVRTTLDAEKVTADWFSYLKKCAERTR